MKLKSFLKGLPTSLEGVKGRDKRRDNVAGNNLKVQEPVYEVDATVPEEDAIGLVPPPSSLPAPWAVRPEPEVQQPVLMDPVANKEQAERPERAAEKMVPQAASMPAQSSTADPRGGVSQAERSQTARPSSARPQAVQPQTARPVAPKPAAEPPLAREVAVRGEVEEAAAPEIVTTAPRADFARPRTAEPIAEESRVERPAKGLSKQESLASQDSQRQAHESMRLPPHIQLRNLLARGHSTALSESAPSTPYSTDSSAELDSQVSSGTVVVNHAHDKPSLTFTASIEDYARKADPSCWEPAKFKKSQFVRVSPGTYPVPHKKLSESRHQYTKLDAYSRGNIHQINKQEDTRDPREFVTDEGMVLYRVYIPKKVNSSVEFIFVPEENMTLYFECSYCNAYATEQCSGCKKDYYCSEACALSDWKVHRHDCKHKGKTAPPFGSPASEASESILDTGVTGSSNSQGLGRAGGVMPKRKFRDDGTVKIYNAHKPDPEMYKGSTTILPKCLRPLTLEEEAAPPPDRIIAWWRSVNHPMRRWLHKGKGEQELEWGEGPLTPGHIPNFDGDGEGKTGLRNAMPTRAETPKASYNANAAPHSLNGLVEDAPVAEAQVEAVPPTIEEDPKGELIGEALGEEDASAPKKGPEEVRESPMSDRSAESLVEGVGPDAHNKKQLASHASEPVTGSMPDLPRIRVSSSTVASKATKLPSRLVNMTAASGATTDAAPKPAANLSKRKSMPDVFKRLTAGTFFTLDSQAEAEARAAVADAMRKEKELKAAKKPVKTAAGRAATRKAPMRT